MKVNDYYFYKATIYTEILNSFEVSEIDGLKTFDDFFAEVDVRNAYEDEWDENKERLKPIYKEVYEDIKVFLTNFLE